MSKADSNKAGKAENPGLKARLPRGFVDRRADEIAAQGRMLETIRATFELYGFEALETPFVEYTEALGKFLPDLDRPNEGVFSFQDDDEAWLSLRYDLTAPLARHVAENFDAIPKPYRSFRSGFVFRNEKPGPGRFRQFMQFDADIVGAAERRRRRRGLHADGRHPGSAGLAGRYVIKVNNRKVLDGVLEAIGLSGDAEAGQRLTVLRAMDKFDKFGAEGVRLLLGPGRKDESGDFTKGAGLAADQAEKVIALLLGGGTEASPTASPSPRRCWRPSARARRRGPASRNSRPSPRSSTRPATAWTGSASTRPWCAASNTIPARSTRPS